MEVGILISASFVLEFSHTSSFTYGTRGVGLGTGPCTPNRPASQSTQQLRPTRMRTLGFFPTPLNPTDRPILHLDSLVVTEAADSPS